MTEDVHLYYSPLLANSKVAGGLWLVQKVLLRLKLSQTVYVSPDSSWATKNVLTYCHHQYQTMYCHGHIWGEFLRRITLQKVLVLAPRTKLKVTNEREYEQLMWTLTLVDTITPETAQVLKQSFGKKEGTMLSELYELHHPD